MLYANVRLRLAANRTYGLVGVIGGLLTMGIIGLFIGPVVLAVGYTLLDAWIKEDDQPAAAAVEPPKAQ